MRMADAREPVGKAATVLRAARHAFLASGFGAVSMDAIAREAAVSKATVYAHFNSKEALFGAVVADVAEQHFGGRQQLHARAAGDQGEVELAAVDEALGEHEPVRVVPFGLNVGRREEAFDS